jgi:4-amino-4-deoxy-L-arabinose transferase-like glycosyltransferase
MRHAPLLLLAVACVLVLATGLDRVGFTDVREARQAEVARELIAGREPLTPRFAQQAFFDQPVLGYAPEVLTRLAGADSPLVSRRLRAVLALALVLVTWSAGARLFGARAGTYAALALVTMLALPHAARTDGTQLLGTLLGWLGVAGIAGAMFLPPARGGIGLVAAWSALAAALVVAGPLPALWPLGALALHVALARPPLGSRPVRPLAGALLMLGVALPWYGAMTWLHGGAFLAKALVYPYAAGPPGPWYGGPLIALSFVAVALFPWSGLLPEALRHAAHGWRRPSESGEALTLERRQESAAHFMVACLVASCVPLALYPGPPLTAVLPALPAAALLCGRFIAHLEESPEPLAPALARATFLVAASGTAAALLVELVAARVREGADGLHVLGAVAFASSWLPFLAQWLGRRRLAALLVALPVALGTPVLALRVLPAMEGYLNARGVALALEATAPARAPLVLDEPPPPSLLLYTSHVLVVAPGLTGPLDRWRASDSLVYAAFRPGREAAVARRPDGPLEIVMRTPTLVLARLHPAR